ncbi:MAG: FecR domain-containing protein [Breznakibacter sp.]
MERELLIKYLQGDATDHEKTEVVAWLDVDPANMKEYHALQKLYLYTLWHESPKVGVENKPVQRISIKRFSIEILKVAAVFALAFFAFHQLYPKKEKEEAVVMQTLFVPAGQRAQLTLADGTSVWLNANTTLTFPNRFDGKKREVKLAGEGYFDVVHDSLRPFYVKTTRYDVKVWGTEFNVMAYAERGFFETALLAGSVEVMVAGKENGVLIEPNQRLYTKGQKMVKAPISHFKHFLWREGIISFENESFVEMVRKLELYFDLTIEVKNREILKYQCTGKFRTKDGVEHILKVLQLSNQFSFKIDHRLNKVTIN